MQNQLKEKTIRSVISDFFSESMLVKAIALASQ